MQSTNTIQSSIPESLKMKLSLLIAPISITLIESRVNSYNSDKPETEHISLSDVISFLESQWKQVLGRVEKEIWINVNAVKTSTVSCLDDIDNIINASTKNSWRNNPELAIKERQKLWELIQIIQQEWEWLNDEGKIYQALRDNYIEDTETYDDKKEDFFKKKEQFKKHAPHMDFSNFIDQLFSICPYGVLNTLFQSNVIDGNSTWTERDKQLVIRNMAKIEDIYFIFDRINNPDYLLSKSRLEEENKSSSHISQVISKFLKDELNIDNLLEKEKYILCARKSIVTSIRSYLDIPDPDYRSIQWVFNKIKGEKPNRYIYTSMDTVDLDLYETLKDNKSKQEELKKLYTVLLKSANNFREICTEDELDELNEAFEKYKESLIKSEKYKQEEYARKNQERENNPEAAEKYVFGAIANLLEDNNFNIKRTVQEIHNPDSRQGKKIIRYLEIHNINIKENLEDTISWKEIENDSWTQLNRIEWQWVYWVLFELKRQPWIWYENIKKLLETEESRTAFQIIEWYHANYIDELPDDVWYEASNSCIENIKKQLETRDIRRYGEDNNEEHLRKKRELYNYSNVAISWWLAPEWKKISLLRDSIWWKIRENKLNKSVVLDWFNQIQTIIETELKKRRAVMNHSTNTWETRIQEIRENLKITSKVTTQDIIDRLTSKWKIPESISKEEIGKIVNPNDVHKIMREIENERTKDDKEELARLLQTRKSDLERYWITSLENFALIISKIEKLYKENIVWTRKEREENSEKSRKVTWSFFF